MGYYIKKTGLSGKTVYWTGGVHWSDDSSKKKTYVNKSKQMQRLSTPMVKMVVGQVQLSLVSS
ncbi:MAG: hypothetical protein CM15mP113_2320 [Pseudomonadota bacterium]|nr:MAG: hypothetical protein CM15mP113_2320 [Pseudomonadota bacterium]